MNEPAFDVLDALGGLARLVKRTPTLDGAVPARVAQGCSPMLEGNAFGFQIVLTRALFARARWGGVELAWASADDAEDLARRARGVIPRLVAEGLLDAGGAWAKALARGPAWTRGARAHVWTGLLVRPRAGVWLRVSACANRRNRLLAVDEGYFAEPRFVPLVVSFAVDGARGRVRVEGELASLAPLAPGATIEESDLAGAPEVGRAHATFYDAKYFETKKKRIGAKYRLLLKRNGEAHEIHSKEARCRVVRAGPAPYEVRAADRFVRADTVTPGAPPRGAPSLPEVVHANAVAFRASFDGHTLSVEKDERALAEATRAVESAFAGAYGASFARENRGALWYLTKYFTPHPPGEPHFFVKPWAFFTTPPGWSTLVEGVGGAGYDVLRGVVATDAFHATPAVLALHDTGRWIDVPAGAPIVRTIPFPRALAQRPFHEVSWS